jgi:hypothetical protein
MLKNTIFWDLMPSSPLKVNQYFAGKYCLYFRVEQAEQDTSVEGVASQIHPKHSGLLPV